MKIVVFFFYQALVLLLIQTVALGGSLANSQSSSQCYKCVNAVDLSDCTYVRCDGATEDCFMERGTTDSGRDVYNAGCKSSIICKAYGSSGSISSIGRKRARTSCLNCCHSDKCNNNLCGIPPGNVPYAPTCYACDRRVPNSVQNEVRHPEDCKHQTVCQTDEVCIAEISIVGTEAYHYFGCDSKLYAMNNTFATLSASGNIPGKRGLAICHACCGDSGCNHEDCYTVRPVGVCCLSSIVYIHLYKENFTDLRLPKANQDHSRIVAQKISHEYATKKIYNITWYNPPIDLFCWPKAIYGGFKGCKYSNCLMKFDKKTVNQSDAVIFYGRAIQASDFFKRKLGQIWIFASIEAPAALGLYGSHWAKGIWVSSFNWTMTYDKSNTDIFLPYGEIKLKQSIVNNKNYSELFHMKNKTALIVHSNCNTYSKREKFVAQLGKHLEIDSFGKCGKSWNCGHVYKHDDCFRIINTYNFYLSFENAFCDQYFTEKIFQNFNYDSIMVIRGGRHNDTRRSFPPGTYISTEDFKSVKELAEHLKAIANSEEMYTKILEKKSRYHSIPYEAVYRRAMCDLCERMNKQELYKQHIKNITQWAYGRKPCEV